MVICWKLSSPASASTVWSAGSQVRGPAMQVLPKESAQAGPPASDQEAKVYDVPLSACGVGALSELDEPGMTVTVNGVACVVEPTVSCRPVGLVLKVRLTVFGFNVVLTVLVSPTESAAVSSSSTNEGYSWSGAVNEPLATPVNVFIRCVWQLVGVAQWCRITRQVKADAGNVPSWGSVACPEKLIVSPTAHVNDDAGASITAVGALFPAEMVTVFVSLAPSVSVTVRRAVYVPAA